MEMNRSRRQFLANMGRGALVAAVGIGTASKMGLTPAWADDGADRLTFGPLEPLVGLMQETPAEKLIPTLVRAIQEHGLKKVVTAAVLANARTFGGEDYIGFHTMMALSPAYHMAEELPEKLQPLPVLKVLYRNTNRIRDFGGPSREVLKTVRKSDPVEGSIRDLVRKRDLEAAEGKLLSKSVCHALDAVLPAVQDNAEVHRVALAWRSWDLRDIVGNEHAKTLLRQSVRYCVRAESHGRNEKWDEPRTLLPKLFDQHGLESKKPGDRTPDDSWIERTAQAIFRGTPQQAADTVAAALAEGIAPGAVGQAVSLAANQLLLRDVGRTARDEVSGKPMGSVHGDSIGVHACDSANAWRQLSLEADERNSFACLILGAWQAAYDRVNRGGDFLNWSPLPLQTNLDRIKETQPEALLRDLDGAVRENLQARACALVARVGELGGPARPVFDVLLKYAISEDGALHAEKFYRTTVEEFAAARPAFKWRYLVGLARVTASECGRPAPGVAEAKQLLSV